jgi:hypothetical protein
VFFKNELGGSDKILINLEAEKELERVTRKAAVEEGAGSDSM